MKRFVCGIILLACCGCDPLCKHTEDLGGRNIKKHTLGEWSINTNMLHVLNDAPVLQRTCSYCGWTEYR